MIGYLIFEEKLEYTKKWTLYFLIFLFYQGLQGLIVLQGLIDPLLFGCGPQIPNK